MKNTLIKNPARVYQQYDFVSVHQLFHVRFYLTRPTLVRQIIITEQPRVLVVSTAQICLYPDQAVPLTTALVPQREVVFHHPLGVPKLRVPEVFYRRA
jgi:hypothetical protein